MPVEIVNNRAIGIHYLGKGDPMLLLHCALAHSGALKGLMTALQGVAHMAVDLPGHGESRYDPSADIQAQAVETAIALLEARGPMDVFGHSFGATVALRLAIERPDLVKTLTLYEPVYFAILAGVNQPAYEAEAADSATFTRAAAAQNWEEAARAFLTRWNHQNFDALPEAQKAYLLKTIPLVPMTMNSIILPEAGATLRAQLPQLTVPVLLLEGAVSPPVITAINNEIAARLPRVMRRWLKGVGHMGPVSDGPHVAAYMAGFLGQVFKGFPFT